MGVAGSWPICHEGAARRGAPVPMLRPVALLAHLSDLHLLKEPVEQEAIFDALVAAVAAERANRGCDFDLLAITGDVFDTATIQPHAAVRHFCSLHERLRRAMGVDVPTVIVPGNHDRRRIGLVGPHRETLFRTLRDELGDAAWVHGTAGPILADVVDPAYHGLPLWIVVYDSTYVPHGWLSAGGMLRQQDLLYAASRIGRTQPDWPVLVMLHHHLVPTPFTDLQSIILEGENKILRWGVEEALPWLVAHADREELTMTALGAGTALSTLHTLGRAVLVLHGHKHYATARLLDGTFENHGDVMLVSAGSAGTAQEWSNADVRDMARLWPSFNVIELDDEGVAVETVSFGWKGRRQGVPEARPLIRARREGAQWIQQPIAPSELMGEERLEHNCARFTLQPSTAGEGRLDYLCEREVKVADGARLSRYAETIIGDRHATLELLSGASEAPGKYELPCLLHLSLDGITRYRVAGGIARELPGMARVIRPDRHIPFAWLGLMNRYPSATAELRVEGLGRAARQVFASATDLGTGLERPLEVEARSKDAVRIRYEACPPRTLIRAYWPRQAL